MPTTKTMLPYLLGGVIATMVVYSLALITGTDFSKVSAPPSLYSPIPWWLFLGYSAGGALAMFPLFIVASKTPAPRLVAQLGVLAGLALMTPAPFLVSEDLLTIFWLTSTHFALVVPLLVISSKLSKQKIIRTQQ